MYCGADIKVREAIKIVLDANIPNLLTIANEELKVANYKEAVNYYNKVLEYEIENSNAWMGKAICSLFTSDFENLNEKEFINYFENAVKYGSDNPIIKEIPQYVYDFANDSIEKIRSIKNHSTYNSVNCKKYFASCSSIIKCLEISLKFDNKNKNILLLLSNILQDLINGSPFKEKIALRSGYTNVPRMYKLENKVQNECLEKLNHYKKILHNLN
jgi:tetratricopeptide (TPR) repeat protein